MAVIIREERLIGGRKFKDIKVYRSDKFALTEEAQKQAQKLDEFLAEVMAEIGKEAQKKKLLSLKGKSGALELWYFVGKKLHFVDKPEIVLPEDKKYIWRALYDHAGELAPGPLTKRVLRDPATSHFSYCYLISRFPWEFVKMAGDWTSWSEFFDRKETKNDPRIIQWIGSKTKERNIKSRQNWLRPLTKAIHKEFAKKDTAFFQEKELYKRLDEIFLSLSKNEQKK